MRIRNILLDELEMPLGCKMEIKEVLARNGIEGSVTLPLMVENKDLIKKKVSNATLDALTNALCAIEISPGIVNHFATVKTGSNRKREPKPKQTKGATIELIDEKIAKLQELKEVLQRAKELSEELGI